jgi:hypothetical protein
LYFKAIIISLKEKRQKWNLGVTMKEIKILEVFSKWSGGSSNISRRNEI